MKKKTYIAICQDWNKNDEPDGYSLHISEECKNKFLNKTNCLEKPIGGHYQIEISGEVYKKLNKIKSFRSLGKRPVPGCIMEKIR